MHFTSILVAMALGAGEPDASQRSVKPSHLAERSLFFHRSSSTVAGCTFAAPALVENSNGGPHTLYRRYLYNTRCPIKGKVQDCICDSQTKNCIPAHIGGDPPHRLDQDESA